MSSLNDALDDDGDDKSLKKVDVLADKKAEDPTHRLQNRDLMRLVTRGLNRNHNRVLKNVFKGAANAAVARPGPLKDDAMVARGMREELARVTLARKLAAIVLRLWKKGEPYDAKKLTLQAA